MSNSRNAKPSEIPWASVIPDHWLAARGSTLTESIKRAPQPDDETVTAFRNGQVTLRKNRRIEGFTEAIQEFGYQGVRKGDLVIHSMDGFAGAMGISDSDGKMSPVVHIYRVSRAEAHFLVYALRVAASSGYITSLARGIRERSTSFDRQTFRKLWFPCPPLDEQRAIADYLDQETAQIDALVAKQEEFIGLLRERRNHAREVLASHVSTGPRLRWTLHEVDLRAGTRAVELPLFSVSINWGVRRRDETTDKLSRAEELDHYKVCLKGDIVINRMRAFQGALGVAPADGVVSPDYAVLRTKHNVDPEWLAEVMRTKAFVSEITQRLRGIGGTGSGNVRTPRINTADLLDIRAHIPTVSMQQTEIASLTAETSRIDNIIAKAEEHIALAKERRSALITAAVTGQFDVRTAEKGARV